MSGGGRQGLLGGGIRDAMPAPIARALSARCMPPRGGADRPRCARRGGRRCTSDPPCVVAAEVELSSTLACFSCEPNVSAPGSAFRLRSGMAPGASIELNIGAATPGRLATDMREERGSRPRAGLE